MTISSPSHARSVAETVIDDASEARDMIDYRDWEVALNLLEGLQKDIETLTAYVEAKVKRFASER